MAAILSKAEAAVTITKWRRQPSALHKMAVFIFRVKGHAYVTSHVGGGPLRIRESRPRHVTNHVGAASQPPF